MEEIYLDNNASTRVAPEVREALLPYFDTHYGNASSVHKKGLEAERALKEARRTIARILGAEEREVIFTSGASESDNIAVQGVARANGKRGKHIITTAVEHDAVLEPLKALEDEGFEITRLAPDENCLLDPDTIAREVRADTILVAVMHVNNETGSIFPIGAIARAVKEQNPDTIVFSDGVQGFGKLPVQASDVDLYAASGHKLHAPKGIGILYIKNKTRIEPLSYGGKQEFGMRPGTENVPGAVGFATAAELAREKASFYEDDAWKLRTRLEEGIREIPDTRINSPEQSVPTTINAAFYHIPAEVLLHALEQRGIYVSTGSACAGGAQSHVLKALPIPEEAKRSSIRIGLSRFTTADEIDATVEALKEVVPELRKVTQR